MNKHVFLTGEKQCGKSTIIRTVLDILSHEKGKDFFFAGFKTFFLEHDTHCKTLYLTSYRKQNVNSKHIVMTYKNGVTQVFSEVFNALGVNILTESMQSCINMHTPTLFVMDECGRFENNSLLFIQKIITFLNGHVPVLGVLQKNNCTREFSWHEMIKNHSQVSVLSVSKQNRNDIVAMLVEHYKHELFK